MDLGHLDMHTDSVLHKDWLLHLIGRCWELSNKKWEDMASALEEVW
jgi:hypothetical protein